LLARSDCPLSKATAARSTLPAYPFNVILNTSYCPFGLRLPSSTSLIALSGYVHCLNPLPSSVSRTLKLPSSFRSPSGLSSFRIEALNRWLGLRSLPLRPARFPFAPRKRQLVYLSCCSRLSVAWRHLTGTAITSTTTESHTSYDLPSFVAVATVCLQAICLRSSGNSSLA